jgi:hypothetical protein
MKTVAKKEYEKPAVIYTQVMESVAGACNETDANGKTGEGGDNCQVANS